MTHPCDSSRHQAQIGDIAQPVAEADLTRRCAAADCGERVEVEGRKLCASCAKQLYADLSRLPALFETCGLALIRSRPRGYERVTVSRGTGLSLVNEVVEIRSEILRHLTSLSVLAARRRGSEPPLDRQLEALTAFVLRDGEWLASDRRVGQIAETSRHLVRRAVAVSLDEAADAAPVEIGRCVHPNCDSSVVLLRGDAKRSDLARLKCKAGHSWPPHQWLLLARQMKRSSA